MKKQALFYLFSFLYLVFISSADLYSAPEIRLEVVSCCSEEDNSCCGEDSKNGHCQNSECCHISTSTSILSIRHAENKIEYAVRDFEKNIRISFERSYQSYVSIYNRSIAQYESYLRNQREPFHSYLKTISSFLSIWRC